MFNKLNEMKDQFLLMQKLMQNEDFKAFVSHPKVQEFFKDTEFLSLIKNKQLDRLTFHPKFKSIMKDPKLAALFSKLNPKDLL